MIFYRDGDGLSISLFSRLENNKQLTKPIGDGRKKKQRTRINKSIIKVDIENILSEKKKFTK